MAVDNRGIGYQGRVPWRLPAEMAHFRATTMGHAVLMGRKTYESLPGGFLDGRELMVLSARGYEPELKTGVLVVNTLNAGLTHAREVLKEEEAFVAGGGEIYAEALRQQVADRMLLTIVNGNFEADAFFPEFDEVDWDRIEVAHYQADEINPYAFTIWEYRKKVDG